MLTNNSLAAVAGVIGEPARAAMLSALMDGRALTATELAHVAGITPQTASAHLARLLAANLIAVDQQGRHRYHRLASRPVASLLEGLMQHAAHGDWAKRKPRTGPRDEAMRRARTCYDHLAGRLGVAIADALIARNHIVIEDDAGLITAAGERFFAKAGIALQPTAKRHVLSRPLCRLCLDWSERRPHLAGRLGATICAHGFDQGWFRRREASRAILITAKGEIALAGLFGIKAKQLA